MMRFLIIIALLTALPIVTAYGQLVEIVFGPLEGDNAGILYADTSQTIEVDLWIKTAPGISIVGFHIPLSSKDEYILGNSREGGEYSQLLHTRGDVSFFNPYYDQMHEGYTNQSFFGLESDFGEYDCYNGIWTEGEWWWVASFRMTTVSGAPTGIPFCDALIEGYDEADHYTIVFACYGGNDPEIIDPSQVEMDYACLEIQGPSCGYYLAGDFNGSGEFNVADIVDSFSNLKIGSPEASFLCECPPNSGNEWAVAMDVNGSCSFNVADIVTGFSYLKTGSPEPIPCGICPPGEP